MRVCFEQKTFLLADSNFQVFSSKSLNAFIERDKTKFARSFFPTFFCSSAIAKSSDLLLILFWTIHSDAFKLDSARGFLFFLFCSFVVHCFVYYLGLFCLFWVFTIGIYTFFCLRTINLDGLDCTSEPKHQKFIKKNAF